VSNAKLQVPDARPVRADKRPPGQVDDRSPEDPRGDDRATARRVPMSRRRFVQQLRVEKRRSDRSRAPLSLVAIRLPRGLRGVPDAVDAVLELIERSRRETDCVGFLGEAALGVLLPYTDAAGRQAFVARIATPTGGLGCTTVSGTYPDQLFESLAAECEVSREALDYLLEEDHRHSPSKFALKRCLDVIGALLLLVAFAPVMVAAALAVKATSPGPAIFRQVRLGRRGTPFVFYKFRSMRIDADDGVHRDYVAALIRGCHELVNQGDAHRPLYKLRGDPRVTAVGRFLRRTSIDELPQLFNVLKGDMSLVGPRPPIPYEAEKYQPWHLRRVLEARPGLTGLWQVEGRSRVSFDEMVRLDLRYARNWSLPMDLAILARTVGAVLRLDGEP
jgi:lipopolysaccharide/colanic/teichoic acid biosynthesis glycosyltransferase